MTYTGSTQDECLKYLVDKSDILILASNYLANGHYADAAAEVILERITGRSGPEVWQKFLALVYEVGRAHIRERDLARMEDEPEYVAALDAQKSRDRAVAALLRPHHNTAGVA